MLSTMTCASSSATQTTRLHSHVQPCHRLSLQRSQQRRCLLQPLRCSPPSGLPNPSEPHGSSSQAPTPSNSQDRTVADALSKSLTEVSKAQPRIFNGTNLLLVNDTEESWRRLDKKVNKYPIQRTFTAIGTGGAEFRAAAVAAVASVVGGVHVECIAERQSSKGAYISVTVGPVWVENADQIIQVYTNLKADERTKWII